MSGELTEKKRRNIRGNKALVQPETVQEPTEDLRTPYTGDRNAVLIGVESKNLIPTSTLLNIFIKSIKEGKVRVESKAESDKTWLKLLTGKSARELMPSGFTDQDITDYIHEFNEPIASNFRYTFTNGYYDPVDFKVTKINRIYGFTRQDTGECCNFTIVKDKRRSGFTFKLQPLDYFNLPEWAGG